MKSHAIFLVNVRADSVVNPVEELKQIDGIYRVEEVTGVYDFMVEVETTLRLTQISDILMAKPWIKRLHVLRPIRGNDSTHKDSDTVRVIDERKDESGDNRLIPAKSWVYQTL